MLGLDGESQEPNELGNPQHVPSFLWTELHMIMGIGSPHGNWRCTVGGSAARIMLYTLRFLCQPPQPGSVLHKADA